MINQDTWYGKNRRKAFEKRCQIEKILEKHFPEFKINTYVDNHIENVRCWRELRTYFQFASEEITKSVIRDKIIRMLEDLKKEIDSDIERIKK